MSNKIETFNEEIVITEDDVKNAFELVKIKEAEDIINKPKHYNSSKIQPIEAIEEWGLNFNIGQVIKYCARAGKKPDNTYIQDLKKAQYYLSREISNLESK